MSRFFDALHVLCPWRHASSPRGRRRRRPVVRPQRAALEAPWVPAIVWINPHGGAWDDPNNWQDPVTLQHRVPHSGDDVSWALAGETLTVVNSGGCRSFTLGASSNMIVQGSFNVVGDALFGGPLSIAIPRGSVRGVSIGGAATMGDVTMSGNTAFLALSTTAASEINGTFAWGGGMLSGGSAANPIQLNNDVTISGSTRKTLAGYATSHLVVDHTGSGELFLS